MVAASGANQDAFIVFPQVALRAREFALHLGVSQCPFRRDANGSPIRRCEFDEGIGARQLFGLIDAGRFYDGLFEGSLTGSKRKKRQTALALSALCVGGMVLARTLEDSVLAEAVRSAAHAHGMTLLKLSA
jgi:hypothetical protein